jgi:RNA polymerase sigma-70 factor (ECF subfamily)
VNIILMAVLYNEDEGDREFIISLYRQYYPIMKQRAYFMVKDYAVVDDLIHETFIKLIPKISLLRSLSCYKVTSYIINSTFAPRKSM